MILCTLFPQQRREKTKSDRQLRSAISDLQLKRSDNKFDCRKILRRVGHRRLLEKREPHRQWCSSTVSGLHAHASSLSTQCVGGRGETLATHLCFGQTHPVSCAAQMLGLRMLGRQVRNSKKAFAAISTYALAQKDCRLSTSRCGCFQFKYSPPDSDSVRYLKRASFPRLYRPPVGVGDQFPFSTRLIFLRERLARARARKFYSTLILPEFGMNISP